MASFSSALWGSMPETMYVRLATGLWTDAAGATQFVEVTCEGYAPVAYPCGSFLNTILHDEILFEVPPTAWGPFDETIDVVALMVTDADEKVLFQFPCVLTIHAGDTVHADNGKHAKTSEYKPIPKAPPKPSNLKKGKDHTYFDSNTGQSYTAGIDYQKKLDVSELLAEYDFKGAKSFSHWVSKYCGAIGKQPTSAWLNATSKLYQKHKEDEAKENLSQQFKEKLLGVWPENMPKKPAPGGLTFPDEVLKQVLNEFQKPTIQDLLKASGAGTGKSQLDLLAVQQALAKGVGVPPEYLGIDAEDHVSFGPVTVKPKGMSLPLPAGLASAMHDDPFAGVPEAEAAEFTVLMDDKLSSKKPFTFEDVKAAMAALGDYPNGAHIVLDSLEGSSSVTMSVDYGVPKPTLKPLYPKEEMEKMFSKSPLHQPSETSKHVDKVIFDQVQNQFDLNGGLWLDNEHANAAIAGIEKWANIKPSVDVDEPYHSFHCPVCVLQVKGAVASSTPTLKARKVQCPDCSTWSVVLKRSAAQTDLLDLDGGPPKTKGWLYGVYCTYFNMHEGDPMPPLALDRVVRLSDISGYLKLDLGASLSICSGVWTVTGEIVGVRPYGMGRVFWLHLKKRAASPFAPASPPLKKPLIVKDWSGTLGEFHEPQPPEPHFKWTYTYTLGPVYPEGGKYEIVFDISATLKLLKHYGISCDKKTLLKAYGNVGLVGALVVSNSDGHKIDLAQLAYDFATSSAPPSNSLAQFATKFGAKVTKKPLF